MKIGKSLLLCILLILFMSTTACGGTDETFTYFHIVDGYDMEGAESLPDFFAKKGLIDRLISFHKALEKNSHFGKSRFSRLSN